MLDESALDMQIQRDIAGGFSPLAIVGTLGSTTAGLVDRLDRLAAVSKKYDCWFHVDAAWGGATCLLPEYKELTKGVELSDSLSFDPHKWLSQPMGVGLFLTRHAQILKQTFSLEESVYMPAESYTSSETQPYLQSMQWSRRFLGLKIFLTLAIHGLDHIRAVLRHQIEMGEYLKAELTRTGWKVENDSPLPVACFSDAGSESFDPHKIATAIESEGDFFLTPTALGGTKVLRAGISNQYTQKKNVLALVEALRKYLV